MELLRSIHHVRHLVPANRSYRTWSIETTQVWARQSPKGQWWKQEYFIEGEQTKILNRKNYSYTIFKPIMFSRPPLILSMELGFRSLRIFSSPCSFLLPFMWIGVASPLHRSLATCGVFSIATSSDFMSLDLGLLLCILKFRWVW